VTLGFGARARLIGVSGTSCLHSPIIVGFMHFRHAGTVYGYILAQMVLKKGRR